MRGIICLRLASFSRKFFSSTVTSVIVHFLGMIVLSVDSSIFQLGPFTRLLRVRSFHRTLSRQHGVFGSHGILTKTLFRLAMKL